MNHITQETAVALAKQTELFSKFGLIDGVVTNTVANARVHDLCNAAIQHYLDAQKASGWQLVPTEATREMVEAAFSGLIEDQDVMRQFGRRREMRRKYEAMLAAAPQGDSSGTN